MPPTLGSIHRRPRRDSGAARLWPWARSRRAPWTTLDAAEAAKLSPRRTRAIVAALHAAGLLDRVREAELAGQDGQTAAEWTVSEAGRQVLAPILIVNGETGAITGIRGIM